MRAELRSHFEAAFVTLTYENAPLVYDHEGKPHFTLVKKDAQKWIKKIRNDGNPIRYFTSGEYGTQKGRPHYHVIVYGLGLGSAEYFEKTWNKGYVSTYEANPKTMAYVAKYCLKVSDDPEPSGRSFDPHSPETRLIEKPFRLMSLRPPIGSGLSKTIADSLMTRKGSHALVGDVKLEKVLKFGRESYPLDRTMRNHVQDHMGLPRAHSDALFRRDYPEPTNEQTQNAAEAHVVAYARRKNRRKL